MQNPKDRKADDFYRICARRIDSTPQTIKKYLEAIFETVAFEMYARNEIYVPMFGVFYNKHYEAITQRQNHDGEIREYKVPEHDVPQFAPDDEFIDAVNMSGVTKSYRKRLKENHLNEADLRRISMSKEAEMRKVMSQILREKDKQKYKEKFDEEIAKTKEAAMKKAEAEMMKREAKRIKEEEKAELKQVKKDMAKQERLEKKEAKKVERVEAKKEQAKSDFAEMLVNKGKEKEELNE